VFISVETVEKPIRGLAIAPDGVDFGGILFFLELTCLSWPWVLLCIVTQHFSLSFTLLCKPVVKDLFHVVNHAIEQPLDIHLDFSSQSESVQSFVGYDIGKDWFY
jgi:hypothetical protein